MTTGWGRWALAGLIWAGLAGGSGAAPIRAGMPVAEYATRLIKKALVGTGAAEKAQVMAMVQRLLPGCGSLGEDEADALAVAIAHAHLRTAPKAGAA